MAWLNKIWPRLQQSDNFYSLAGNLIYSSVSIITFLLMVRLLDKEIYGRWVIYVTAVTLINMFRHGLTGTPAIRLISMHNGTKKRAGIAASYQLSILTNFVIALLFIPCYFLFGDSFPNSYYIPVLLFYPLLALSCIPYNQAEVLCQGEVNFKRLLVIKGLNIVFVFVGITLYIFSTDQPKFEDIALVHILMNALCGFVIMLKKWDAWHVIWYWDLKTIKSTLNFGWFSTASYIGSNLLRSSDTFIMSMSAVMGANAIAIYAIPLKFVELIEIPLRSFTTTAFPKLSQAYHKGHSEFNILLSNYLVGTAYLILPILLFILAFTNPLLVFIGGEEYADSRDLQRTLVNIMCFYILMLPFDRFSGVALFALDKPKLNFWKIWLMLFANVVFDCIAVFVFSSLPMVAVATLLFTALGVGIGWWYIYRESAFSFSLLLQSAKEIWAILPFNNFKGARSS
ncbi:MAG: oligosaccharide flippase family protein [Saprospiraceae bacterium]|nr:oligosaccharide flippase family protein [Saprospiraceae bacterium]